MQMKQSPIKILVVRNDKLGDFVLIFPALALLKSSMPHAHITVLVPQYTADLAKICPWIDDIIIDPGSDAKISEQYQLLKAVRSIKFDSTITFYSTSRIGFLLFLANIKYRLAPATKIAQIFYNNKLIQRRSRSQKPEFEYNKDLVEKYLYDHQIDEKMSIKPPFLEFQKSEIDTIREEFYKKYNIPNNAKLIFVHPGTGGSANNLSLEQYASLIRELKVTNNEFFIITAGPNEGNYAKSLLDKIKDTPCAIFQSTDGLVNFAKHILLCNIFISGSTGPLHIAGALNRPTAAFYQRLRSATPLRWQTLNTKNNRLAFTPPESANETDMQAINATKVAKEIIRFYF